MKVQDVQNGLNLLRQEQFTYPLRLRDEFVVILRRLSTAGFLVTDEVRATIEAAVNIVALRIEAMGQDRSLTHAEHANIELDTPEITSIAPGDVALLRWLELHASLLANDIETCLRQAFIYAVDHPHEAVLIYPTILFQRQYRLEVTHLHEDYEAALRRAEESAVLDKRSRLRMAAVKLTLYLAIIPTAALEGIADALTPSAKTRRKGLTFTQRLTSAYKQHIGKFETEMKRRGNIPDARFKSREAHYREKAQQLQESLSELLEAMRAECRAEAELLDQALMGKS